MTCPLCQRAGFTTETDEGGCLILAGQCRAYCGRVLFCIVCQQWAVAECYCVLERERLSL
jgi:hypothetical protein